MAPEISANGMANATYSADPAAASGRRALAVMGEATPTGRGVSVLRAPSKA